MVAAEEVGRVTYTVGACTGVLVGGVAVVHATIVGPVISAAGIAAIPYILGRVSVDCLDHVIEEIVVKYPTVIGVVENDSLCV